MNKLLWAASLVLLTAGSCKKDDPLRDLPAATQTGANTMGCLVDGQAFTPGSDAFFNKSITVYKSPGRAMYFSFWQKRDKLNRFIILLVRGARQPGTYALEEIGRPSFPTSTPSYANYSTSNPEPSRDYYTGPTATGQLTVTRFDSVAKVISGTFEFTAQETNGTATVHVTQGRFDLPYPQ